jgi:DNA-binding MarR family transcriptional regulator
VRSRSRMLRDRSTVKTRPGLFLQPYIVSQLVGALIEAIVEGSEVSPSEYTVTSWLNVLASSTPTELAYELGLAPTTVSAMVDRLVQKGQIRRTRNPEDGRSYVLELTPRGKATNARNARRFEVAMREMRSHLEGDPEEILDAMRRLEHALRKTHASQPLRPKRSGVRGDAASGT